MRFDSVQLMRAAEEFLKYFIAKGATSVSTNYDIGKERSYCAITAKDLLLLPEDIEYLKNIFAGPVQPEIASYYGTLAGRRRDELELELVGTMAELEYLHSELGMGVQVLLSRREQESRSGR